MVSTKFFLDCRKGNAPYPLKLRLNLKGKSAYLMLNVKLNTEQWDGVKVIKHPRASVINNQISAYKADIDMRLYELQRDGELPNELPGIKALLEGKETRNDFFAYFDKATSRRSANTQAVYRRAQALIKKYDKHASFDKIDKDWLYGFDEFLSKTMVLNTRSIIMRTLRAVFNDALDDEVTTNYPFRKFKIKEEPTKKRSLSLESLRVLRDYPVEEYQRRYRDLFILMVLMRGINIGDLCLLQEGNIVNGRIEYIRQKTHKVYSIKLEPEMLEIINRYRGRKNLLDPCDTYARYNDFIGHINDGLKSIGTVKRVGRGGKKDITPMFPGLSTYWARHTFATIAHVDCGIPIDMVADLLGHSNGNDVTNIYIRKSEKAMDEAARKVIDAIMKG